MKRKHLKLAVYFLVMASTLATFIHYHGLYQKKENAEIFAKVLAEAKTGEVDVVWAFSTCLHRAINSTDEAEVLKWLTRAANDGDHYAETAISSYYFAKNRGDIGLSWLIRAAHNGNPVAQLSLGDAYERGTLLKVDNGAACTWYERAASNDNAEAQYRLALFYLEGISVPKDSAKAQKLMTEAASNGSFAARVWLRQPRTR